MPLGERHPPPDVNCDPLAPWYRWLEYAGFGRALERRRTAFLGEMATARRVLVLGDGDGRFLACFLRANPKAEVDCVDNSARMLELARRLAGGAVERVQFHHADALFWQPPVADYDLIVTHFFLDCFADNELRPLLARLATFATPDARWIVSEFRQPPRGLAAIYSKILITGLYLFFGVLTGLRVRRLPDYAAVLNAADFRLETEVVAHFGLLTSQLWRFNEPRLD